MSLLVKINKLGKTVIVVTHEKNLVDYYKQRVVSLKDGYIVEDRVGGMFSSDADVEKDGDDSEIAVPKTSIALPDGSEHKVAPANRRPAPNTVLRAPQTPQRQPMNTNSEGGRK